MLSLTTAGEVAEIGDSVVAQINTERIEGVLICASGMGLTPLDLFNDIMVAEMDLKIFLTQNFITDISADLPGLIIQVIMRFFGFTAI